MDVDGNDQIYAWKGPGWNLALYGGTYRIEFGERPTHAIGLYRFVKANGNVFYTHNPREAANIFNSTTWDASKDSNGNLAPRYWVYKHNFYWGGKLTYAPGETFSSNDTYVINHGSDGPQDTMHKWWKDTNDQCVANAYIDLGLESDSFNRAQQHIHGQMIKK